MMVMMICDHIYNQLIAAVFISPVFERITRVTCCPFPWRQQRRRPDETTFFSLFQRRVGIVVVGGWRRRGKEKVVSQRCRGIFTSCIEASALKENNEWLHYSLSAMNNSPHRKANTKRRVGEGGEEMGGGGCEGVRKQGCPLVASPRFVRHPCALARLCRVFNFNLVDSWKKKSIKSSIWWSPSHLPPRHRL